MINFAHVLTLTDTSCLNLISRQDAVRAYTWASLYKVYWNVYILGICMHISARFDGREY